MFAVRDREAGNIITTWHKIEHARGVLNCYELEDRKAGTYTPDFYEIAYIESPRVACYLDAINAITETDADGLHVETPDWSETFTNARELEDLAAETMTEWLKEDTNNNKLVARYLSNGYRVAHFTSNAISTIYTIEKIYKVTARDPFGNATGQAERSKTKRVTIYVDGEITID